MRCGSQISFQKIDLQLNAAFDSTPPFSGSHKLECAGVLTPSQRSYVCMYVYLSIHSITHELERAGVFTGSQTGSQTVSQTFQAQAQVLKSRFQKYSISRLHITVVNALGHQGTDF